MGDEGERGLRTNRVGQHKAKFSHQRLDMIVQSTSTLQVGDHVRCADLVVYIRLGVPFCMSQSSLVE